MLAYRKAQCRFRNRLKRIFSPEKAVLQNTPFTRQDFKKWLDQGYDKLNIGGGPKNLQGFVNIDFVKYPDAQRQVVANILDLAFIPDACVSHVHSNHLIEHLTNADLVKQIREWRRILKREGLLTVRCPSALGAAYGFWFEPVIESGRDEFVELGFPADENFGNPEDQWVHKDFFGLVHWFYGDPGNIVNQHLNQVTPSLLHDLLVAQGFNVLKMTEPEAINIVVVARK
jgi:SAM-dependent methyltransferase